jgi:site-specific recombinase XerD
MSTELIDPMASVRHYLEAERASNTRRAYKADWADFQAWCKNFRVDAMPAAPADVARYLAQLADAGRRTSTIQRRAAAIASLHKAAGFEPPTNFEGVKAVMRGIRRRVGRRKRKAAPATAQLLADAIDKIPATLKGLRDRALVLVGFAAALRRSELVALQVEDLSLRPKGALLHIGRSKTDQEGEGAEIPIPNGGQLKPVQALQTWLAAAGITKGPLFRSVDRHGNVGKTALTDGQVARIVKQVCRAAGLEASAFSGHSLRAGFVTSALDAGVDTLKIMKQTRHVKVDTLKEYDRREKRLRRPRRARILVEGEGRRLTLSSTVKYLLPICRG